MILLYCTLSLAVLKEDGLAINKKEDIKNIILPSYFLLSMAVREDIRTSLSVVGCPWNIK
jgi:hypothetical protein